MIRAAFLVFLCGWIAWFMLDKPGAMQSVFPQGDADLLANFQYAFDLLKAGYPGPAYIFIWKAHYIVLSLLGGALLAMLAGVIGEMLGRRRMRKLLFPWAVSGKSSEAGSGPGPDKAPAATDRTSE